MSFLLRGMRSVVAPEHRALAASAAKHVLVFSGHVVRYACYIHVFTEYVAEITLCVGPSMMPTLNESGDVILTESVARRLGTLKRGDVVVATSPRDAQTSICKRIIAVEGDRVCVNPDSMGRKVFRTVPNGSVWLQGDNLSNSTDSRTYGPVPLALVKSRAVLRLWPLDQIGTVDSHYNPEDWPQEALPPNLHKRRATEGGAIRHRPNSVVGRNADSYTNIATCNNTKDDAQLQDTIETHKLVETTETTGAPSGDRHQADGSTTNSKLISNKGGLNNSTVADHAANEGESSNVYVGERCIGSSSVSKDNTRVA